MNEDPTEDDFVIDVQAILTFVTGADTPPPTGFTDQPEIRFDRDEGGRLPHESTCAPTLYLPCSLKDPDYFCERMDFAVCCAHGFGNA